APADVLAGAVRRRGLGGGARRDEGRGGGGVTPGQRLLGPHICDTYWPASATRTVRHLRHVLSSSSATRTVQHLRHICVAVPKSLVISRVVGLFGDLVSS